MNAKVNNWEVELSDYNIKFKCIKGVKNTLADTLSRLLDLELTEPHSPEKEGYKYEYGYAMFEQLLDIYHDSSKYEPALSVDVLNIDVTVRKDENKKDKAIKLSLITKELIDGQNSDTFCSTMLKLIND